MSTPESKVRDKVVGWAKRNNFLHQRMSFRIGVRQAFPDDLFVAPGGIHVWVEFKRAGAEPTPLQYDRLEKMQAHGCVAFWCNDVAEGIAALMKIMEAAIATSQIVAEAK